MTPVNRYIADTTTDEVMHCVGVGAGSLAGFAYDKDPAEGGHPMIALTLEATPMDSTIPIFQFPPIAADLDICAGLIAEILRVADQHNDGMRLQMLIDQHRIAVHNFHDANPLPDGARCPSCNTGPTRGPLGRPEWHHQPGCTESGSSPFLGQG